MERKILTAKEKFAQQKQLSQQKEKNYLGRIKTG